MKVCPFCAESIQDAAVICRFCGRDLAELPATGSRLSRVLRGAEVGMGMAAGAVIALLLLAHLRPGGGALPAAAEPSAAQEAVADAGSSWTEVSPVPRPAGYLSLPVMDDGELRLRAGDAHLASFALDDTRACALTGEVQVTAGGNRDIDILLMDEAGHRQWQAGGDGDAVFNDRRATATSLYAPLPGPGRYVLILSNRFSVFTGKSVQVRDVRVLCP